MEYTVTWTDPGTGLKIVRVAFQGYKEDDNDFFIRIIEAVRFVHGNEIRVFIKEKET